MQDELPRGLNDARKALYLVLCAIMGIMLFVVLQRAAALIYYLLLSTNFKAYSLGLNYNQLSWLNFLSFLAALFLGLWYGVWLGLHWYRIVYEQGHGGFFHHFHFWRHKGSENKSAPKTSPAISSAATTIKPTLRTEPRMTDKQPSSGWELDDLLKKDDVLSDAVKVVSKMEEEKPKTVKAKTSTKPAAKKKATKKVVPPPEQV